VPLFRRSKPAEARQWSPEPVIPPFPGATVYGTVPADTPSAALQVPAVWACVRLKADAVSSLTLHRYRKGPDGIPVEVPLGPLLERPSPTRSLPEWLFDVIVSGELRGNVFGRIIDRDVEGRPSQIELADPDSVKLRQRTDGSIEYRFGNLVVPNEDVWHVRGFSYPGSVIGLSTLTYAAASIGLAAYAERFASGFFADGAHPSSVLSTDHAIDQAGAQTIKDRFTASVKGRQPVVLGMGLTYTPIQVTPEESQFLATQQFSVTQIARFFGVPASLIGGDEGNSMTYANVEQRTLDFYLYAVQPWLRRIEQALSDLLPPGEFVVFDTSSLLRTDAETRAKVQAIQVASRTRTLDELRRSDGLAPLTPEQLKALELVPLEVTPLGGVKNKPVPSGAGAGDEAPDANARGLHVTYNIAGAPPTPESLRLPAPVSSY
jgi:HK97 family phage portal protein